VVQSVFRTFFGRVKENKFHLEGPDDLCKLLVRITVHKVLRKVAFHTAAKRAAGQEVGQEDESRERLVELLDRGPTPEAAAEFLDQLEHFFSTLSPLERQVVELRLQGYTTDEISTRLGTYDRKVRRIMERIRGLAEQSGFPLGEPAP
jgi:RNA polymerase sigma-70 factor (ECF subfamily)